LHPFSSTDRFHPVSLAQAPQEGWIHVLTGLLAVVWLALLPIVAGIGIVAVSDLSFTTMSMAITFLANTCFVLRSLFVKKIFEAKVTGTQRKS
jgi:hypothetical protein